MGLEKSIKSGREHRKPYAGAKAADRSCRNHGSCSWCRDSRLCCSQKREEAARSKLEEFLLHLSGVD